MIISMRGLALRFFQANKIIASSCILTVMLAVSLIITMTSFSSYVKQISVNELHRIYGDMDLSIQYESTTIQGMDDSFVHQITSLAGVQQVSAIMETQLSVNGLGIAVDAVGVDNDDLAKSKYHFQRDIIDHEAMMNQSLAESLGVGVGDRIQAENSTYLVSEVLDDQDRLGKNILILPRAEVKQIVQERTNANNEATLLLLKVDNNYDSLNLAASIRKLDSNLRVEIPQEDEIVTKNQRGFQGFTVVLSVLVVIVSILLLISNFELLLYKNKNQLAILRSIGASTKQIVSIAWYQCGIITVVGAGLGFLLSWVIHHYAYQELGKLFSFKSDTSAFQYTSALVTTCICVVTVILGMLLPSIRNIRVLPLKVVRSNEENNFVHKNAQRGLIYFVLIGGVFLLIIGGYVIESPLFILISSLMIVIGLMSLLPIYLSYVFSKLASLLKLLFGPESYVAVRNLIPQVKRNTFVILTISAMVIITVFGSTILQTGRAGGDNYVRDQFDTPIVITGRTGYISDINHSELKSIISRLPTVQGVSITSSGGIIKIAKNKQDIHFELADLKEMEKQGLLTNLPDRIDNAIIVTRQLAESSQLQIGDSIDLVDESTQHKRHSVIVTNIVEKIPGPFIDAVADWDSVLKEAPYQSFGTAFISTSEIERTLSELKELKRVYPELQIESYDQAIKRSDQMFYQRWYLFIAAMIVILLSVTIGVFNMLVNNIQSKRKEFAILRAISVDRTGIKKVIVTQVMLFILVGLVQGIGLGLLLINAIRLIDSGSKIIFDFMVISLMGVVMLTAAAFVFTWLGHRMGSRKVTLELQADQR
ncbi:FtsX-like permease family protein [Cohnella abietis]|uniref:ABC transporter permease n=1 Tax=Cohnella abietis TaxID=2507935 RepID=A0A3T1D9X4_9BACL|nr:FtsX-like permease family protein [Cohnella abietis]BBI34890.1 ABC transporter permease [Cohnella abietis]